MVLVSNRVDRSRMSVRLPQRDAHCRIARPVPNRVPNQRPFAHHQKREIRLRCGIAKWRDPDSNRGTPRFSVLRSNLSNWRGSPVTKWVLLGDLGPQRLAIGDLLRCHWLLRSVSVPNRSTSSPLRSRPSCRSSAVRRRALAPTTREPLLLRGTHVVPCCPVLGQLMEVEVVQLEVLDPGRLTQPSDERCSLAACIRRWHSTTRCP